MFDSLMTFDDILIIKKAMMILISPSWIMETTMTIMMVSHRNQPENDAHQTDPTPIPRYWLVDSVVYIVLGHLWANNSGICRMITSMDGASLSSGNGTKSRNLTES